MVVVLVTLFSCYSKLQNNHVQEVRSAFIENNNKGINLKAVMYSYGCLTM